MIIFPGLLGSIATVKASGIVTDGLILHLDAQNPSSYPGSGTDWYDLTNNNNDATLYNTPTFETTDLNQKIFDFDDTSLEYAAIPNLGTLSNWTIEAWFKILTPLTSKEASIICNEYNGSNLNFSMGTNGGTKELSVGFFDGGWRFTTGFTPVLDTWYHVVGTYDGSSIKQYVNGTLYGSPVSYAGSPQSGGQTFLMKKWDGSPSSNILIDGKLAVALIYNRALNSTEVSQNYNALSPRYFGTITGYISGSSIFTSPVLADSFEFQGNWNDTVDITTILSGNTTFTTPDFGDGFEFEGNWNDTVDITTVLSGTTTYTAPVFNDSFETGSGGW